MYNSSPTKTEIMSKMPLYWIEFLCVNNIYSDCIVAKINVLEKNCQPVSAPIILKAWRYVLITLIWLWVRINSNKT